MIIANQRLYKIWQKKQNISKSFVYQPVKYGKFAIRTPRYQANGNNSGLLSTKLKKHTSQENLDNLKNKTFTRKIQKGPKQSNDFQNYKGEQQQDQFQPNFNSLRNIEVSKQQKFWKQNTNLQRISRKQLPYCKDVTNSQIFRSMRSLKQTSSTASNDLFARNQMQIMKSIPSFVKKRSEIKREDQQFQKQMHKMRQSFKIIKKLGQGKFGKVFLVKQIHTNMVFAMKIVQKQKILVNNLLNQFIRQLKIHSFLDHPNIIKLYGFFHDNSNFYVIMECGCDGQLYQLMNSQTKPKQNDKIESGFSQTAVSFLARNLINAVAYMHANNILHRDIKPQNILMVNGFPKICDLGWTVNLRLRNNYDFKQLRGTFCGTPLYLSPQLLRGQKYDEKVDLWAIGVLVYQLLFNNSPFQVTTQSQLYKIITDQIMYPQNRQISQQVRFFLDLILKKDPEERVGAKQLLQTKFIKMYKDIDTCQQLCL